jgi:hypothetical protein
MDNIDSKTLFFLKAFLAGIIGSSALYYYWNVENETIDIFLVNFHWFFGEVIIFWFWLGKELQVKGWLRAGLIGSVIYSFFLVTATNLTAQLIGKPLTSLWSDAVFMLISIVAGGLGAIPQWYISRKVFSKAYQWIFANAIGYGMLRFVYWLSSFSYENNILSYRDFIKSMSNLQMFNNLSHACRYGLFGIILGLVLYNFVRNKSGKDNISLLKINKRDSTQPPELK